MKSTKGVIIKTISENSCYFFSLSISILNKLQKLSIMTYSNFLNIFEELIDLFNEKNKVMNWIEEEGKIHPEITPEIFMKLPGIPDVEQLKI